MKNTIRYIAKATLLTIALAALVFAAAGIKPVAACVTLLLNSPVGLGGAILGLSALTAALTLHGGAIVLAIECFARRNATKTGTPA
jgi:hypothetical protein